MSLFVTVTKCTEPCPDNSHCNNGQCVCDDGYQLMEDSCVKGMYPSILFIPLLMLKPHSKDKPFY